MPDPLRHLVVYGSVRNDRAGIGLARFLAGRIETRGDQAVIADPQALKLPMLDRMYKEYPAGKAPPAMERMAGMIRAADAVVVVSGEYNHGIPPALKNLLDHFLEEWFFRPSAIACYSAGRFGGVRAAMALRMVLPELGMPTISSMLPVPGIGEAVTPEGRDRTDWLTPAADRFLDDLAWWAKAARARKAEARPPY